MKASEAAGRVSGQHTAECLEVLTGVAKVQERA